MPKVTGVSEDEDWGTIGATKKVHTAKNWIQKGGFASKDTIIDRIENQYWKIKVHDFQYFSMGFYAFIGEWQTEELSPNNIRITYTYRLETQSKWLYPFQWMFVKLFWKTYMSQVMNNIRKLCEQKEPYLYS